VWSGSPGGLLVGFVHFMRRQAPQVPREIAESAGARSRDLPFRLLLLVRQRPPVDPMLAPPAPLREGGALPTPRDVASGAAAPGPLFHGASLLSPPFLFRTRPTGHSTLVGLAPALASEYALPLWLVGGECVVVGGCGLLCIAVNGARALAVTTLPLPPPPPPHPPTLPLQLALRGRARRHLCSPCTCRLANRWLQRLIGAVTELLHLSPATVAAPPAARCPHRRILAPRPPLPSSLRGTPSWQIAPPSPPWRW
jgi:hypothetical protein